MVCDECDIRASCNLLQQYMKSEELYKKGDTVAMNELYNLLELREAYLIEMRKNILTKLNNMK